MSFFATLPHSVFVTTLIFHDDSIFPFSQKKQSIQTKAKQNIEKKRKIWKRTEKKIIRISSRFKPCYIFPNRTVFKNETEDLWGKQVGVDDFNTFFLHFS